MLLLVGAPSRGALLVVEDNSQVASSVTLNGASAAAPELSAAVAGRSQLNASLGGDDSTHIGASSVFSYSDAYDALQYRGQVSGRGQAEPGSVVSFDTTSSLDLTLRATRQTFLVMHGELGRFDFNRQAGLATASIRLETLAGDPLFDLHPGLPDLSRPERLITVLAPGLYRLSATVQAAGRLEGREDSWGMWASFKLLHAVAVPEPHAAALFCMAAVLVGRGPRWRRGRRG